MTTPPRPCATVSATICARYGRGNVIRDVHGRTPLEYVQFVQAAMRRCRVAVLVIGPGWAQARDASRRRLLDNPFDPVRVEIQAALSQRVLLVPLLVEGATMPPMDALPPDIAALVAPESAHRH